MAHNKESLFSHFSLGRIPVALLTRRLFTRCFDFILPPRCPESGKIVDKNGQISPQVWKNIDFIQPPFCLTCGKPFEVIEIASGGADSTQVPDHLTCGDCLSHPPHYDRARAAMMYNDSSRSLILMFKHGDKTLLNQSFGAMLAGAGADLFTHCDLILPVPLHRWRLLRRRYNQSALLAYKLHALTRIPTNPFILERVRATPPQGHLSPLERAENVKSAFFISPKNAKKIAGKNVIVVDDVMTTGATANECAQILKKSGAARVDILCAAKVVK